MNTLERFCVCGAPARRYGRYHPDASEQRWRCTDCGRIFLAHREIGGNRFLTGAQRRELKRMLLAGVPVRMAAKALGCAHKTVIRYYRLWDVRANCPCGLPSTHQGWCAWRVALAPDRRAWLWTQWQRCSMTDLSTLIDRAIVIAEANGHQLGVFVWGKDEDAGLWPYAKCLVCGSGIRFSGRLQEAAEIIGTATRKHCLTREQRAADRAAQQEKKSWHEAKRTLRELKRVLRSPSPSRSRASTPAPSSPR